MEKKKQKINSIDLMRVICAYMVVAIHTHPGQEYNTTISYIFTQVIPRIAVPFFFAVSGYFFTASLISNKSIVIIYFKRILFTYTLWSFVYFIIQYIIDIRNNVSAISMMKSTIINYFVFGSWYHFWYFPALIFCVLISSLFNKLKKIELLAKLSIVLYIMGVLGCAYYYLGIQLPVINRLYTFSQFDLLRRVLFMGLPFFMIGYFVNKIKGYFNKINNKTSIFIMILILILFVFEIIIVNILHLQINIFITLFLYPLTGWVLILCTKNPMKSLDKFSAQLRVIGNLSFYSHPLLIMLFGTIVPKLIGITISETYLFLATCISTTSLAVFFYRLNNKWINKIMY